MSKFISWYQYDDYDYDDYVRTSSAQNDLLIITNDMINRFLKMAVGVYGHI